MKIAVHYVNDQNGKIQAVQVPVTEWKKLLGKLKKYKQVLKLRSDLKEAFEEVAVLKKAKAPKQTLTEFLDAL